MYPSLVVERRAVCLHREAVVRVSNFLNDIEWDIQKYGFGDRDGQSPLL